MTSLKPHENFNTCTRCIMDSSDQDIVFDEVGVCNHCHTRDRLVASLPATKEAGLAAFERIVQLMKVDGQGRDYDCLLGISGGVDSCYLAHIAVKKGLRPLIVHFDNGWNSELALKNIESVIMRLGLDLQTYVVEW